MANEVRSIGLKEANRALKMLPDFAKSGAQQVMDSSAFQVARGAAQRVRYRTGFLKAHIEWESRPRSVTAVVGVDPQAFYWKFLEYGTVNMPASPAFRPAAQSVEGDHESRLVKALTEAANKVERAAGSRLL